MSFSITSSTENSEIKASVDISCYECGNNLEERYDMSNHTLRIRIYPCEKCLKKSFSAGCEWQSSLDKKE